MDQDMMVKQEGALVTDEGEMLNGLMSSEMCVTSLKAETPVEKAKLFNMINNPDGRIADSINLTIFATDIYCEIVSLTQEDGSVSKCPRILLIDKDGKAYQSVSTGIYSALRKIISIYGPPHWDTPIPITIKQINKGEKRIYTMEVNIKELEKAQK